jgi:hypothetical protein
MSVCRSVSHSFSSSLYLPPLCPSPVHHAIAVLSVSLPLYLFLFVAPPVSIPSISPFCLFLVSLPPSLLYLSFIFLLSVSTIYSLFPYWFPFLLYLIRNRNYWHSYIANITSMKKLAIITNSHYHFSISFENHDTRDNPTRRQQ